jgi:hypothetical protein
VTHIVCLTASLVLNVLRQNLLPKALIIDSQIRPTLPLSGRQGAWVGEAKRWWRPVHSKGLFGGSLV